jgi:hypothetical protein
MRVTDLSVGAAERHFTRRIEAIRNVVTKAQDFEAASRGLLGLGAKWTPNVLAAQLQQAMTLAALEGREAVFAEADGDAEGAQPGYASAGFVRQEFRNQIDFLTQKRGKPTRAWTDAMHGDHDRAFVVAGATDLAMLEEFQAAIVAGAETYDIEGFTAEFDRIVEKYGWSYNGGREWRIRTIFETNIRTSYMAGRMQQMRDPKMVKRRPYWQYVHADTRQPKEPRPHHLSWDGLVLRWDDPWWDKYFPPNDWMCSCGVRTLSEGDLRRLGKDGPDDAPLIDMQKIVRRDGTEVWVPKGIGYGWDYMPGDLWERGLVPSALIEEAGGLEPEGRHRVLIDAPEPLEELLQRSRPFNASPLSEHLADEDYVRSFLLPFGADLGQAVLWEDPTGTKLPVSEELFRDQSGAWKVGKRDRARLTPLIAETLLDPDEIWVGVSEKKNRIDPDTTELLVDRRYIRTDSETGLIVVFQIGRKWWEAITAYPTTNKKGDPDPKLLDKRRGGKLLWKRK